MEKKAYNFVFVMPDSMRAESLGCYGHPAVKTPNIDALASEGTLFQNCYSQFPMCAPARCCMLTGLYPHNKGYRGNMNLIKRDTPNLFSYMRKAGYYVSWLGKNDMLDSDCFLDSVDFCYDRMYDNSHGKAIFNENGEYSFAEEPMNSPVGGTRDYKLITAGMDFIKQYDREEPFALYLALNIPHVPFTIPEPYYSMYNENDVDYLRPAGLPDEPVFRRGARETHKMVDYDENRLKKMNAIYLGMISYSDMLLGRIVETLKSEGKYDNTIIVYFSDHGEYGGDYGLVHKQWCGMEDVMLRVPFIFRVPGGNTGQIVKQPVALMDFFATIADLADVKINHRHFSVSLKKQLFGRDEDPDRVVFSEGGFHISKEERVKGSVSNAITEDNLYYAFDMVGVERPLSVANTLMLRNGKYKFVYRPGDISELYDMADDPLELRNLYYNEDYIDTVNRLKGVMLDFCVECSDPTRDGTDDRNTPVFSQDEDDPFFEKLVSGAYKR